MKFLTFIIVMFNAVMLTGCERQFLSPIKEPLRECDSSPDSAFRYQLISEGGFRYQITEILVKYDQETWEQQTFPVPVVNNFLISKGYTPKIKNTGNFFSGFTLFSQTEHIVSDLDLRPVLKELVTIAGVVYITLPYEYLDAVDAMNVAGSILVTYDEEAWAGQTSARIDVNNYLQRISTDYTTKGTCIIPDSRTEVIYLGRWDIDIYRIMAALVRFPGVEYVQPFFLYEDFDYIPGPPIPNPEFPVPADSAIEGN